VRVQDELLGDAALEVLAAAACLVERDHGGVDRLGDLSRRGGNRFLISLQRRVARASTAGTAGTGTPSNAAPALNRPERDRCRYRPGGARGRERPIR
jgi:hypothetical protein